MKRILSGTVLALPLYVGMAVSTSAQSINFWKQTRTGANAFNKVQTEEWFEDANDLGVSWVRLAFDKWYSERRDFLVGNAGDYQGLVADDLAELRRALDWAHANGLKVVLSPLTLPGARYGQNNGFKYDSRLWRDPAFSDQANQYWHDLATALSDHPAIVAYNIINEPAPELGTDIAEHVRPGDVARFKGWYDVHQDTPADLYSFYNRTIATIREIDPDTPVMVDAGWYAQPGAFTYWPGPLADNNVLYSFHMYEPYAFTSHGNFKDKEGLSYPGNAPFGGEVLAWDAAVLRDYLAPFYAWADRHKIPRSRLVAGEFGCYRRNEGCQQYLSDVINIFEENETHWAFYSFREDEWDGYDYEVGR
ncbi:MAG: glycoside hydrolase family 5 protein [Sulfitobacter sp.]